MKKTILLVLIVLMVSTPCLAEVEPDGMFTVDNTVWSLYFPIPIVSYGFFEEKVYWVTYLFVAGEFIAKEATSGLYSNFFFFSTFQIKEETYSDYGILFPFLGVGILFFFDYSEGETDCYISLLFRTMNDWTPPEIE